MSDGKVICPECCFEFAPAEAARSSEGKRCPRCKGLVAFLQQFPDTVSAEHKEEPPLLSEGTILDKYRILSFLGAGGMSEVYKAEHLLLKQVFALKIMKKHDATKESILSKRFLREAKCFHLLEHPHIVRIYDIGCDSVSGVLYIAMEYLPGGKLDTLQKFSEQEILKVASDIAHALLELEKHRMVHRDIKPSNILRSSDGSCKLTDLGIAKNRWDESAENTLTLDNCLMGTPAYTSPEQCRSPHDVDIRSDIYSLGVTLYQLASGMLPYQGETPLETVLNVLHKEPPSLRKVAGYLSGNTIELIECMMEKSPEKRPRNALMLCRMIETVQQGNSPLSFRRHFPGARFLAAAFVFLLAAGAGTAVWFFSDRSFEKKSSSANTPAPGNSTFLQSRFISADKPRTLPVRLAEFRKIIAFLKSPASGQIPFREERLKLFTQWEKKLSLKLKRKKQRQTRRDRVSVSPVLKAEIENFLKRKTPPFIQTPAGMKLTGKILAALKNEAIDPDTLFADGSGNRRSLTGLAFNGMLPMSEHLLKRLIFSGADIDAGHGPDTALPPFVQARHAKRRMTGIMTVNGADNVDLQQGKSMLLTHFEALHLFLKCRPPANDTDWFLLAQLVESGARLDVRDSKDRSPVHLASLYNRDDLLEKILLAGAPAIKNDIDRNGETPYMLAVRNHASKALKVLKRFGLDSAVTEADRAQGALIYGIIKDEPLQVEQPLYSGASLNYIYANKLNALQNAVVFGRKSLVKFLLEQGASFDINSEHVSMCSIAVCAGSPDIFRMILERGAPENMTVKNGASRFWLPEAVLVHHRKNLPLATEFFEVLRSFKWNINQPGPRSLNILEHAVSYRDISVDLIRMLLEKGADPGILLERKKVQLRNVSPAIQRLLLEGAGKKLRP